MANEKPAPPSSFCGDLDDYLDGDIEHERREPFEAHLARCAACREAIEFASGFNTLLRQATNRAVPAELRPAIERQIHKQATTRRRVAAVVLSAAASIALFVTPWRHERPAIRQTAPDAPAVAKVDEPATKATGTELPPLAPQVSVETGEELLAVRKPTKHPNVSVFWLYPTVRVAGEAAHGGKEPLDHSTQENAL
jgi:hypothetical protein